MASTTTMMVPANLFLSREKIQIFFSLIRIRSGPVRPTGSSHPDPARSGLTFLIRSAPTRKWSTQLIRSNTLNHSVTV
jgi:hypothetical protein